MRIAIGGFQHESHSFAPLPTGWPEFLHPGGFPPLQRPATLVEAQQCAGEPALIVGGGNSAGQAAMFLSGYASSCSLVIRGLGM